MLRRLANDTLVYGLGGAGSKFLLVLLIPLYTHFLTPAAYGAIDLLVTSFSLFVLLSGAQVESGLARSYFDFKRCASLPLLYGTAAGLSVIIWLLSCLVLLPLLSVIALPSGSLHWYHFALLFVAALPAQFLGFGSVISRMERRRSLFMALTLGDVVSQLILIYLLFHVQLRFGAVVAAILASKAMWATVAVLRFPDLLSWKHFSTKTAWVILAFSVPLVPAVVGGWAQSYGNRLIIAAKGSGDVLGLFALAAHLSLVVALANAAFQQAWLPMLLSQADGVARRSLIPRVISVWAAVIFAIAAASGSLGGMALVMFARAEYFEARRAIPFIAIGYAYIGVGAALASGVILARKTWWSAIAVLVGSSVNLGLLWFYVDSWGLLAGGATFLTGSIISCAILGLAAQLTRTFILPLRILCAFFLSSLAFVAYCSYLTHGADAVPSLVGIAGETLRMAAVGFFLSLIVFACSGELRNAGRLLRRSRSTDDL